MWGQTESRQPRLNELADGLNEFPDQPSRLLALLNEYVPGRSLSRPFYLDPTVYQWDWEAVWKTGWIFAAHACEISHPGDYVVLNIGDESVILWHDPQTGYAAFHNVCRHRGTRLCQDPCGRTQSFVCPYHRWTYGSTGKLLSAQGMGVGFDPRDYELHPVRLEEAAGLLFLHLGECPPDFLPFRVQLESELLPHGLAGAKVAHYIDYEVRANWKLIVENNRECYHCLSNHPEYIAATYDLARDRGEFHHELEERLDAARKVWRLSGMADDRVNYSSEMSGAWYRTNRTPLRVGYLTESLDGQPVAPLLGVFQTYDMGTARITTYPNFWCHANSDHAVTTQLIPLAPDLTRIRVTWLVHAEAVLGRDYSLERLLPFWQRTSEQDWELCHAQQQGVRSSAYQPGPYAEHWEKNVIQFVNWYVEQLRETADWLSQRPKRAIDAAT